MNNSINIIVNELMTILSGKSIAEIINLETDNIYNKSAISVIVKRFIDKNSAYSFDLIKNQNIRLKFIAVDSEYNCFEAMSFPSNSLFYMIGEKWVSRDDFEIAHLRKQLNYCYIFIPIVKSKKKGIYNHYSEWVIGHFSVWKPNLNELALIGEEWSLNRKIVSNGIKTSYVKFGKGFRNKNNLPKMSETNFIHLRPHGKNSFDYDSEYLEYRGIEITKQSFWLNKTYLNTLLRKYRWKMI